MPENYLFVAEPEEIFCSSRVKFFGQPVGIILAETHELANKAAELVDVGYEHEGNLSKCKHCTFNLLIFPNFY